MASNIIIIKANSIDLCASLNFHSDKQVTWKKRVFTQEDIKARKQAPLNDDGEKIAEGFSCRYSFAKDEFGKYIQFYAYVENFKIIQQTAIFYVENKCNTYFRIRRVGRINSDSSKIAVGKIIKLKVNEYYRSENKAPSAVIENLKWMVNVNEYPISENEVPSSVKENIKWMVKVDNNPDERLIINGLVMIGDKIQFEIPEEWENKEVLFMPYLNQHTNTVSTRINVEPVDINNSRRKVFYIHGTTSSPQRWRDWPESVAVLNKIVVPEDPRWVDTGFDWKDEAKWNNALKDRWKVSDRLVAYIKENAKGFGEIALVGHSHGGNVAIMAAGKLVKEGAFSIVYVLTLGTPVFNKLTFTTPTCIDGLTKAAETKSVTVSNNMAGPYHRSNTIYTYTYFNPENPENWQPKDKIKHLSLYNRYDRVDGIAKAGDTLIENSRMTSDTCRFAYTKTDNVEIKSKTDDNEKKRFEYRNHCSHRISILERLRDIIGEAERPVKIVIASQPSDRSQDKIKVVGNIKGYELLGFRKISTLPDFKEYTLQIFRPNTAPNIDKNKIKNKTLHDMRFFFEDIPFHSFLKCFNKESETPPQQEYPYPIGKDGFISPNMKKIESEILRLTKEIEGVEAFNARVKADKTAPWAKYADIVSPKIGGIIKYFTDGVDNHSFDIYSPEDIQKAIDEGRIKPFVRDIEDITKTEK